MSLIKLQFIIKKTIFVSISIQWLNSFNEVHKLKRSVSLSTKYEISKYLGLLICHLLEPFSETEGTDMLF